MAKVITFSRVFPSYHPRKGEPTYFVEKIWESINDCYFDQLLIEQLNFSRHDVGFKHHTIRAGHRFKVGDWFSARVWSGKPYQSKQIVIAPDIQIKKIWNFEIKIVEVDGGFASKGFINGVRVSPDKLMNIVENDGLELADFLAWFQFPKPFDGQIICWNENIEY